GREFGDVESLTVLRRTVSDSGTDVCVRANHVHGVRTYKFHIDPDGRIDWLPDEPDVIDDGRTRELVRSLVDHRVWITPTLWVLKAVARRAELMRHPDPRLGYLSTEVRRQLIPGNDTRYAAWSSVEWSWAQRTFERDARLAATLRHEGVHVLAGTDAVT